MRGIVTVRMLQESVAFAFSQLRGDKFRSNSKSRWSAKFHA